MTKVWKVDENQIWAKGYDYEAKYIAHESFSDEEDCQNHIAFTNKITGEKKKLFVPEDFGVYLLCWPLTRKFSKIFTAMLSSEANWDGASFANLLLIDIEDESIQVKSWRDEGYIVDFLTINNYPDPEGWGNDGIDGKMLLNEDENSLLFFSSSGSEDPASIIFTLNNGMWVPNTFYSGDLKSTLNNFPEFKE